MNIKPLSELLKKRENRVRQLVSSDVTQRIEIILNDILFEYIVIKGYAEFYFVFPVDCSEEIFDNIITHLRNLGYIVQTHDMYSNQILIQTGKVHD